MRKVLLMAVVATLTMSIVGCMSAESKKAIKQWQDNADQVRKNQKNESPSIEGTPAVGSKFSKLELGMSFSQVKSIVGESKDCAFNFKNAIAGISNYNCAYKNEGMLIIDWNNQVLYKIIVDPNMGDFKPIQK